MTTMETLLDEAENAVERMRGIHEKWENLRKAQQAYIDQLVAERDKARAEVVNAVNNYITASFERDALRVQLDGMTTEIRTDWKFIPMTARGDEGRSEKVREQRLVGPWVEVE